MPKYTITNTNPKPIMMPNGIHKNSIQGFVLINLSASINKACKIISIAKNSINDHLLSYIQNANSGDSSLILFETKLNSFKSNFGK